jgi:cystatin-C
MKARQNFNDFAGSFITQSVMNTVFHTLGEKDMTVSTRSLVIALAVGCAAAIGSATAQLPGGYRDMLVNDKDVVKTAAFAIEAKNKTNKEKLTLEKIVKAETQVVAGRNFRLTLDVSESGKTRRAVAVVWAKLDGTFELTSWTWPAGAKEKAEPK